MRNNEETKEPIPEVQSGEQELNQSATDREYMKEPVSPSPGKSNGEAKQTEDKATIENGQD